MAQLKLDLRLISAKAWADDVEKDAAELRRELAELDEKAQQDKEAFIVEFKGSEEYDKAIANVGDPEILRCWIVAEKHIKTNHLADLDSFITEFLESLLSKLLLKRARGSPNPSMA